MILRAVLLAPVLAALCGCASGGGTAEVDGTTVTATTSSAGLAGPLGGVGVGVGTVELAPAPAPDPAAGLFGPWTLARAGDRVCMVDLGSRNAVGDHTAKTRRCTSVELARIALWTPTPDGLVLYDFERRPVVTLVAQPTGVYEGAMVDGTRLTLWR